MGSATREALSAARAALKAKSGTVGDELFAAGRIIGESKQLLAALTDPSTPAKARSELVNGVFASLGTETRSVLAGLVESRWSAGDDLLAAVEELGVRVMAASSGKPDELVGELFAFGRVVASDAELELAVNSKLGDPAARADLVSRLLEGKASPEALSILRHLVQQPRGRRIGALIRETASVVAGQSGRRLATVTSARPIDEAQVERLRAALAPRYGDLLVDQVVDPSIIGGLRVRVGDDVIDDSIASKLGALRLQLA